MLGTDELNAYLNKYRLELDPQFQALVGRFPPLFYVNNSIFRFQKYSLIPTFSFRRHSRKPWARFINADNQHLAVPEVTFFFTCLIFCSTCRTAGIIFYFVGGWLDGQAASLWSPGETNSKGSNGKYDHFMFLLHYSEMRPANKLCCLFFSPILTSLSLEAQKAVGIRRRI